MSRKSSFLVDPIRRLLDIDYILNINYVKVGTISRTASGKWEKFRCNFDRHTQIVFRFYVLFLLPNEKGDRLQKTFLLNVQFLSNLLRVR